MTVILRLWARDERSGEKKLDGEPLRCEDDFARTGEEKARSYGEGWVANNPDHHSYDVQRL